MSQISDKTFLILGVAGATFFFGFTQQGREFLFDIGLWKALGWNTYYTDTNYRPLIYGGTKDTGPLDGEKDLAGVSFGQTV